jgi:Tfp pilus assembly protein PilN
LAEVVAEQVGLPLDPAEATGSAQPPVSRVSALPLIALPKSATINILPKDLREQALVKRATRGLIAGTAAVLAFMAITGARIHAEVGTLRATLASERASAEAVKPLLILEEQAQSSTRVLTQAMLRIRDKASTTPRWDAALAMLSQAAPESVRLSSVTMGLDGPTPTIRIQGRTVMPDRVDSGTALKLFLDGLTGIPIVHAARLGATQRQETPAGVSQTFDMSVQLVAVPTADWIETVAASRPVATVPVSPGERP